MSYDNGYVKSYQIGAFGATGGMDFGDTGDLAEVIAVPKSGPNSTTPGVGLRGRVIGVTIVNVTETFVGTTSGGQVLVGSAADTNAYYQTVAATLSGSSPAVAGSVFLPDDGSKVDIPAGETLFTITCVDAVGGSITGIADVIVDIMWYGPGR